MHGLMDWIVSSNNGISSLLLCVARTFNSISTWTSWDFSHLEYRRYFLIRLRLGNQSCIKVPFRIRPSFSLCLCSRFNTVCCLTKHWFLPSRPRSRERERENLTGRGRQPPRFELRRIKTGAGLIYSSMVWMTTLYSSFTSPLSISIPTYISHASSPFAKECSGYLVVSPA